jgi:phosphate transport system protein
MYDDKESALWTIKKDKEIDEINSKFLKKSLKNTELGNESRSLIISLTDIRSIISSIERIGDQATNISEASIFKLLGKNVRHKDIGEKYLI